MDAEALGELPLGQLHDGFGEAAHDPYVAGVADEGGRGGEDVVAEEHRHVVAPKPADGGSAAARVGFVDGVVVDQRCDVQQLDGGRHGHEGLVVPRMERAREQRDRRANFLAAAHHGVLEQVVVARELRLPCEAA